jgi:anti-sigma B factor antagonist
MPLEISHKEVKPGVAVITLEGIVMRGPDAEQIETVLDGLLREGYRSIVFDLSGVKKIDSTGIGRFIAGYNKMEEVGGKLRLAAAQGWVRECFRITRLDTVFRFCETVDDASASV